MNKRRHTSYVLGGKCVLAEIDSERVGKDRRQN